MGRRLAASRISKNRGWIVGSPPLIWTMSGSFSFRTTQSSMNSTCFRERCVWRWGPDSA